MGRLKGVKTKAKGIATSDYGQLKKQCNFMLTPEAYEYLSVLAKRHSFTSKADVIENLARPNSKYIIVPRNVLEGALEDSIDKTSPRYQRLQQLLGELHEYLPKPNPFNGSK